MTNWDKWQLLCKGIPSPQNYIDCGFRFTVAAFLQRRVWCPPEHARLYADTFNVLVGGAGVGKGNIIRVVTEMLQHHKLDDKDIPTGLSLEEQAVAAAIQQMDARVAAEQAAGKAKDNIDKPLLIPFGSSAATYEALVQLMAKSYRRINYSMFNPTTQRNEMKIYGHSSLAICLEEMGSLFKKHAESVVTFLQEVYDCREQYDKLTKTQGEDRIYRPCLNLFAGTTPDFIEQVFKEGLIAQGFSSRAFFVFADKPRFHQFFMPELNLEQKVVRKDLLEHFKKLTKLYGCVQMDADTPVKLQQWWMKYNSDRSQRASSSPKLDYYYARKNIHTMKVAMAHHFGETTEMFIPWSRFEQAIEVLHEEEKTMHLALANIGDNKLSKLAKKILNLLPASNEAVLIDMWEHGRESEINETLTHLFETGQIKTIEEVDKHTKQKVNIWVKA